ncbi:MAG: cobalamin transport system ATP-binding protein [Gaiellaceae bacterium]|nr:cobalamin transport system ATP-binding protein [Gaiellaceae bacterium]
MIELRDVSVRFGSVDAVRDVSLTVESGAWIALIGPNGAGKTSMLRAMCRLVSFRGEIALDGQSVRALSRRELARIIAFVPQTPVTPHELTVAEYVLLGRTPYLAYLGDESRADRLAAQRALDRLELRAFAERALGSLSGGELQRAVLARALAQEAPILMLDEPTTALDLGRQQQVLELVDSLRTDGLTVVSTLHDLTLAGQFADRLVLLDRGAVVAEGRPEDVLSVENLESYYDASVRVIEEDGRVFVLPLRR